MVEQHSSEAAVVVGSSTHYERIERLWRDVQRCVAVVFGNLFRKMEDDGISVKLMYSVFILVECWNNYPTQCT